MSFQALQAVFEHSESRGSERLVAIKLAEQTNDFGYCWPSLALICKHTKIANKRTVSKHIATLEKRGEFVRLGRKRKNGSSASNSYIFCINRTPEEVASLMRDAEFEEEEISEALQVLLQSDRFAGDDAGVTP